MYIPKDSRNLKDQKITKIRLGIQGEPGSGKTTAALTFPNPVVVNFDDGLHGQLGKDIIEIPFWDHEWVVRYGFPPSKPDKSGHPNRKGAILKWLKTEGMLLQSDQTLILDSWTSIQDAFDIEQVLFPRITKETGEVDDRDFWAKKIDFNDELVSYIRGVKCNVVVIFHETHTRDPKTGALLRKIEPLMQGSFTKKLKVHFPNFFRQVSESVKSADGKQIKTEWYWQIKSSDEFEAKCHYVIPDTLLRIKADYNELLKLEAKPINSL